jgi:hypothetical protein
MPKYSKSQIKKKRKDDLVLAKRRIGDPQTPEEVEKITKIDQVLSYIREEEQLGEEIEEIEKARKAGKAVLSQSLRTILYIETFAHEKYH